MIYNNFVPHYVCIHIYIYILDKSLVHQVTTEKVFGAQTPPPNTVSEGVLELYGVYIYILYICVRICI